MVKIDLITGFLGSGKTTFIRKYATHLMEAGESICILENDYGAINVDLMVLKDLEGPLCDLEMVVGGDSYEAHKRRFRTKLVALGMLGYDRVIVEPSGIYDVDEFFDVLHEEPLDRWYQINNIISVVDARYQDLSKESLYLCASQISNAGQIVLSHTQEVDQAEINQTVDQLNQALATFHDTRKIDGIIEATPWDRWDHGTFARVLASGYELSDHVKLQVMTDNGYRSIFYMHVQDSLEVLEDKIKRLFADEACGHVLRVKGFMPAAGQANSWLQINATSHRMDVEEIAAGQEVLIIIGENLDKSKIDTYWPEATTVGS